MTRNDDAVRQGSTESSGAESYKSHETVKDGDGNGSGFGSRGRGRGRGTPARLNTGKEINAEKEPDLSPGSTAPEHVGRRRSSNQIAPWEQPTFTNYRKDLAALEPTGNRIPSISRQPPSSTATTPPWSAASTNGSVMPHSVYATFFNDSNEDVGQLSPGFRAEGSDMGFPGDDRRPSVASATTISSQGSRSSISRGFHKKLQGFFGDDFPGMETRQNSDASLTTTQTHTSQAGRGRNNSVNNTGGSSIGSRPCSPGPSRPRTPMPSSEVTPWEYQDQGSNYKDAPASSENGRGSVEHQSIKSAKSSHHKLRLPGHRHTRSKEEVKPPDFINSSSSSRPAPTREDSTSVLRGRNEFQAASALNSTFNSRTNPAQRSASPTPSTMSDMSRGEAAQRSPGGASTAKSRSILDKLRRKDKSDRNPDGSSLKDLPSSSTSLQNAPKPTKPPKAEQSVPSIKRGQGEEGRGRIPPMKREHTSRLPFKGVRRNQTSEPPRTKDPNDARPDGERNEAIFHLDTDLSHMEDIINPTLPMTPPTGEIFSGWPGNFDPNESAAQLERSQGAAWDAPDSWAVKRVQDENIGRLRELDESGNLPKDENQGPPYCVRIFRVDSTFAVLSVSLNTTVSEIISILGKRSFLQDELDNYQIVMRKHATARQLEPQERPLVIQKRLLEQAGYTERDRIEDLGRDDNSFLCRFTFLPAKMSGYSSLEKDPGFSKMQKFSHIDLQGRNLITIPIALYQKATEIISLNLSRNLSLDVPKDFIQACVNLREIKYTSNEAWRLPPSLSLARRLTMLDVSNNRLEQLEHAELDKLTSLQGLRLSNNKLTSLPRYFGSFKHLRSLNLSSNSLKEFPDFLCEIRTLVDLDISFNSISALPNIGQLAALERLWATNNKLSGAFPTSLTEMKNLREIDVRFNSLTNIDVVSQLPKLEYLLVGHNSISAFEGTFSKIRVLHMNHNPVTRFGLATPVPTLSILNLASAKLAQLPEDLFQKITGLTKLILDKNHFTALSTQIGKLLRLEHLSVARNNLDHLPVEIGRLSELRYLDLRENNLGKLPQEIWFARRLETLNVSSNVLTAFPKPPSQSASNTFNESFVSDTASALTPSLEDAGKLKDFANRRPSQASANYLNVGNSPVSSQRSGSTASQYGQGDRKPSVASRHMGDGTITPSSRKDSNISNRMITTFAGSLRHILLADNQLPDDVFDELVALPETRILNLSYNEISEVPPGTIRRWPHLAELYLSGNYLASLPAEDFEEVSALKVLHINSNKFQVLPAELGKVSKLAVLDVGSNSLKYNVSNWPYDWNWNWNVNLKYLNLSGNKRLEIKPNGSFNTIGGLREGKDLTDFSSLHNMRILGLMDVTMMVPSVPEQTEDRRVRTSGSTVGMMAYGLADSLGRHEHLSQMDIVVPRFRSHDDETLLGMFDGQPLSSGGSKIAKYLYDNFKTRFQAELDALRPHESPVDAFRRTYLGLNKELATQATHQLESKQDAAAAHRGSVAGIELGEEDLHSGSVATVIFLKDMDLFVSNVGDAQAVLIQSEGGHRIVTEKHDPAEPSERARIREAGGFVSRQGKLNDVLEVSRAFGYIQMSPSVIAAPHVAQIKVQENDEMILLASRELWDYLTPDFAVDVARSERGDLMRAAQKLRDIAIAFGATGKLMVMMLGVSDLRSRQRGQQRRNNSMPLGPSGPLVEETGGRRRRNRDGPMDSKLARLDQEVDAPTGEVSLVFTDIKNSTLLWETYPIAMRSAIKMHNELMRRHLRIIGGYEVKTEGDAFMVAFPTVTSALLWCFTIQIQLLEVPWPQEILNSVHGNEVLDSDGNVIFRGLSVRMGIHWGSPVCEVDPVTRRMDYFGPMVNRAARIMSVADGGQITVSSDFIAEIQRLLETHIESDRTASTGSDETMTDDSTSQTIRRELRSLSSQGFEVKDLGERRLKGLENPEYIYLMYPHALASRLIVQQQQTDIEASAKTGSTATKTKDSQFTVDIDDVWNLWNVSLRLEMLCSTLECPGSTALKPPETALLERMRSRGGEITDRFLLNFVEHQISRIETCANTLALRNMVRPFRDGMLEQACSMQDIFADLSGRLAELQAYKDANEPKMAPS